MNPPLAALPPLPVWKRAIDLVFVLATLPLLAALTLVMAVLIGCGSPGPIFFCQERVGQKGRPFPCLKFRTMKVGADPAGHRAHFSQLIASGVPMVKLDAHGDSRLIPLGWLLRASGLDELPQVINLLRGEMSLVGPRPCIAYEYEHYLPWHRQRMDARPGLTGLWQVSGKNRTTFDAMVHLDIEYVRRQSPALDAKIILLTVPAVLSQIFDLRRGSRACAPTSF